LISPLIVTFALKFDAALHVNAFVLLLPKILLPPTLKDELIDKFPAIVILLILYYYIFLFLY